MNTRKYVYVSCVLSAIVWLYTPRTVSGGTPVPVPLPAGLEIIDLNAEITSMTLPGPTGPESGSITATLCPGCDSPAGFIDCQSHSGMLYWPVELAFPLLELLGKPPIPMVMAGPFMRSPVEPASLVAVDAGFGYIDPCDPCSALMAWNKNDIDIIIFFPGPEAQSTGTSGGLSVNDCLFGGTRIVEFRDMTSTEFDALGTWFRSALDTATAEALKLNPQAPDIPSTVLDEVSAIYLTDPSIEIVLYYVYTGEFRTGHLTGDAIIALTPSGYALPGDENGDGKVTLDDFAVVAFNWLIDCSMTPPDPACYPLSVEIDPLSNDYCTTAVPIEQDILYMGTTDDATGTDLTTCAGGDTIDVWHVYTPTTSGIATIILCGSEFDTTLAVFDGCGTGGYELACNDEFCAHQSVVTLEVTQGLTYYIRVSGYHGATGSYLLQVNR